MTKRIKIVLEYKKQNYNFLHITNFFLLWLLSFLIIDLSPSFFDKIQPDSSGYMSGNQSRTITYFLILKLLDFLNIDVIYFQELFLSLSLVSLCYYLKKIKFPIYSIIFFFILVNLNYYYTSFSKTILPESIFFGLINFSMVLMFRLENSLKIILFGILLGLIAIIKPIGMLLSLIIFLFSVFSIADLKKKSLLVITICSLIIIEIFIFNIKNTERNSILNYSIQGKLFFLSGKENFKIEEYPPELKELLTASKKEFEPVHNFLNKIDNKLLRAELTSDYEVVAQFQTFNLDELRNFKHKQAEVFSQSIVIASQILRNNYLDYFLLSLNHYIGLWSIGSKAINLKVIEDQHHIPLYEELKKSSGPMNLPNKSLLVISQVFFQILFYLLLIQTFILLLNLIRSPKKIDIFETFNIVIIQLYIIAVCLTNVSTPRYLMTIYPILIIISIRFSNLIINFCKRSK